MITLNNFDYLTPGEFALKVGKTKSYIYRKIREGEIKTDGVLSSLVILIPETEVQRWLERKK